MVAKMFEKRTDATNTLFRVFAVGQLSFAKNRCHYFAEQIGNVVAQVTREHNVESVEAKRLCSTDSLKVTVSDGFFGNQ